ncbi:ABC transporter permease [Actinomadura verrucosospora]|uniref:Oligopeptide/dipeptide ABC transporter transmembrane protein n=1 Tax=Actinomadura verrucosospora TaxID=46165 RepID=A0A7D3VSR8_ACTVE|nr:ABC transporter permease [Actinomadura verrucosospora]QKG21960.1 oligopeptide/dipeptide ABC transporter transmembrane protein [Actinomadura verrucosospora]
MSDVPLAAPRTAPRWWGSALALAGLVVLGLSVTVLAGHGWTQAAAVVAGLAGAYTGLNAAGRAVFGGSFDLMFWLCAAWLAVLVVAAVAAPVLPLGEHQDIVKTLDTPGMAVPDLSTAHPLGTNNFGLDLLSRVVYGARSSLVVSLGAVAIGMVVGGAAGIAAGYFRRGADATVGVLTNSLLAVPPLILLIALGTVLEPNLRNIAVALSLLAIPGMIRMARASTMAFAQREFVVAAEAMGASRWRVMTRELLPNVVLPLASYGMVMVSVLIVAEASLSFLGLGVQPPAPSWGNMIAEGQENDAFTTYPHIVLVPGVALFLTVFAFNLIGEKARKRWDPRQAKI